MLAWNVGLKTDFTVSVGKSAKYLYKWICKEEYENYLNTYFGGTIEGAWKAVFLMCDLFDRVSRQVAEGLGYLYHEEEAKAARGFLEHVYRLPKDAQEIF